MSATGPPGQRPYKRLSPLTPLARSSLLLLAIVASMWDDVLRGDLGPLAWLALAALVAGAVYGGVSWVRTKYWIEADELRVDTGVVRRQSRRIRVDRLQGIDIVQPFVARLLGLAELRLDVAGGGAGEGSLAFLSLADAQDLREVLLARRDEVRSRREQDGPGGLGSPGDEQTPGHHAEPARQPARPPAPEDRVLARLDLRTLALSTLLSSATVALVVAVVAFGLAFVFAGPVVVAPALPASLAFGVTLVRRFTSYYGFTVRTTAAGLQVSRGLFDRSTQTIPLARVQGVVVTEPLLWRRAGWARVDVSVAGQGGPDHDGGPAASTVMPVAPRSTALMLARVLLDAEGSPDPDAVVLTGPPRRSRWAAPVAWRFLSGGIGAELVASRQGLWASRLNVVPHARVQSLQLRQGPWQRRLGLADVVVNSPPGPVSVRLRNRDAAESRQLLDQENSLAAKARTEARSRS